MELEHKLGSDGSISITVTLKPTGTFLEQEEQIALAVTEVGRVACKLVMESYDTTGEAIIVENCKYTSRGKEKKNTRPRGEK